MKKILVTGASGFLGRFLIQELKRSAHVFEAHSRNCDLTKEDSLRQFDGTRFDQIFHLAAWTQAGDFCLKHPGEQWIINQKINTHMLAYWAEKQPQALLVCMGTSCAYDPHLPLVEENYLRGTPIESLFTYAMTKRMLFTGLDSLSRQFGLKYLYLVPSTLYGPSYHTDGRQLHFIFDLMRKILQGHSQGDPVILWGDGEQKRELVHVNDFISLMLKLIENGVRNTCVNLGAGKEHTIKEFAGLICKATGFEHEKIVYDTTKYVGARSKCLSIKKLEGLLPPLSFYPLEKGLQETLTWFKEHAV